MSAVSKTISVVIPTLQAAAVLPPLLAALHGMHEVVVADGGSTDGTAELAATTGAHVVSAPRGRGSQLRAGCAAARGSWLLALHADSRPDEAALHAARMHIADPENAMRAAYFRFALDDAAPAARRLERMVAWRCRALALPYGDQGLLLSRALYDAAGGYHAVPLMEDVDLVRRLGRARLVGLDAALITSAARFQRDGYLRRSSRNTVILALWHVGVPPRILSRIY
jgi:rSAM/selenodomain-associated transferase 2